MDSKKFLQIVEEKKQKALEKKLARLEWEERLEEAAKAPRRDERVQKKHKRKVLLDSSVDPDTSRKRGLPRQKKRYSSSGASEDEGFRRESHVERRSHGRHRRRDSSSDSSSSDSYRSRKRHRRKNKSSSNDLSDHSLDNETGKRRSRRRHKGKGSDSDDSSSSDEERKLQRQHKQRETDTEDSEKSVGKRKHHGHKHKKHGKRSRGGNHRGHASFQEEDKAGGDMERVHKDVEHRDSKERWDLDRYRSSDVEKQIERLRSQHRLSPYNERTETIQKDSEHGQNTSVTNGKVSSAV